MITKFARLEFEFFTKPSKSDFLRVYQCFVFNKKGMVMKKEVKKVTIDMDESHLRKNLERYQLDFNITNFFKNY